ncbi:MAG TPA: DinB family protein [Gemmatimonadales bacterium]|nr:DinB family protein [Gemmatimonadales bacterium]
MNQAQRVLKELLRGTGAHLDPVAAISGISAALAGRRVAAAPHTIWQLVWHMSYWMDYELRSIAGPEASYPAHATESWPPPEPPSSAAWDEQVSRFHLQLERLTALADSLDAGEPGSRLVHPAKGESVRDVLWQLVAHNSYHTGQVALLRQALGAWPPGGGGDTW